MKWRYVVGLSLLAATVMFTSCGKDEKKEEKPATIDQVQGMYMEMGVDNPSSFMMIKAGTKLKFFNPPTPEVLFTLGETKDGVATLKGELTDQIVKAEGNFTVKDKTLEVTIKEKDKDEVTKKGTRSGDAMIMAE